MLCNADRYQHSDYAAHIPPPTRMEDEPTVTIDLQMSAAQRLEQLRHRQPHDRAAVTDAVAFPAADQALVNEFLLEEQQVYGPRDAVQRLHDVYTVLHGHLAAEPHPPLPHETREQYWRRLASHFTQHYEVCHNTPVAPSAAEEAEEERNAYGDPFYLIDFGRVIEQIARWRRALPMVRPFYAIKCNPFPPFLELLAALGAGFDCASKGEIELVKGLVKDREGDIILANPCKQVKDLQTAVRLGVRYTTFDNEEELEKMAAHWPGVKAVLRLATDDSSAVCAFSTKFGARKDVVPILLKRAAELKVNVCGVSFHVGSGNGDPSAYLSALQDSKETIALAKQLGHHDCHLLDIGGGYPGAAPGIYTLDGSSKPKDTLPAANFEVIAAAIRPVLERDFKGVTIISEPGRYFTEASHALLVHVYARRLIELPPSSSADHKAETHEYQYYVNDGLYNSFNCIFYDHAHPHLLLLNEQEPLPAQAKESNHTPQQRRCHISSIFGPTCDSLDCILKQQPFPEMRVGDWMLVPDMGSYTTAASCSFNSIETRRHVYVSSIVL